MSDGRLAQLVAHPLDVREVTSSSLVSSTTDSVLKSAESFLYKCFSMPEFCVPFKASENIFLFCGWMNCTDLTGADTVKSTVFSQYAESDELISKNLDIKYSSM